MKDKKLMHDSMELSIEVIKVVKSLKSKREYIISNQIGKSTTSIGANIREAQYAQSRADFISKLHIALKESSETGYWLELLYKTDYIDLTCYQKLDRLCATIRISLINSIKTAKSNNQ